LEVRRSRSKAVVEPAEIPLLNEVARMPRNTGKRGSGRNFRPGQRPFFFLQRDLKFYFSIFFIYTHFKIFL